MKRIALLSMLLVPSMAAAQQADDVHVAPYTGGQAAVGTAVNQGVVQYDQRAVFSQGGGAGYPTSQDFIDGSSSGWFGDIGFYVLRPQWGGGNPAFATRVDDGGSTTFGQTDFEHDYNFAPLVQIGYAGRNGLGVRGRWWTLQSTERFAAGVPADFGAEVIIRGPSLLGTGQILPATGGDGEAAEGSFRNRLEMDVIDLEGIWDTAIGRNSLLMSTGVRYAHIGQTYDANFTEFDAVGDVDRAASLRSNNTFSGAGPTASLQAFRTIGQTNLSVYGLSRGSLLFGESRHVAFSEVDADDPESAFASISSNAIRPVLELEVGTNWTRNMGNFDLFAESGLVGMMWFNAGNAANSDTLVGGGLGRFGNSGADNANQDMGLLGLRFSTGVRF